ncbi:MAG: hypothetical protein Q9159_001565 [Coniocarpon cinnabarinum]
MIGVTEHDRAEVKRGRGHTAGAKSFAQRQRSLQTQLGRIDTSSNDAAQPMSPSTLQKSFPRNPLHPQNHSRQNSTATSKSSAHTQDSGFSNGHIDSPRLRALHTDAALSPPTPSTSQFSPSPSPPANLSASTSRKEHSTSPLPVHQPPAYRPGQSRQPSRARNESAAAVPAIATSGDTLADFALEHLFASFVKDADRKIDSVSSSVAKNRIADYIEDVCGAGVDTDFDKLLSAMGHIARSHPEPMVNKIINWKIAHDKVADRTMAASASTSESQNGEEMPRATPDTPLAPTPMSRPDVAMSDRRASAATYMMCRAITEIITQTTLSALTARVAVQLGEHVFEYNVNRTTSSEMHKSPLQKAKWEKATDLLGMLSRIDFGNVCGRYLSVLRQCQRSLNERSNPDFDTLSKARIMLKGMRKLRPRGDDPKYFIEYASCMGDFTALFGDAHGEDLKIQFCRTLEPLLLRLARDVNADLEDVKWRRTVATLQDRLNKMTSKPKYRDSAYPALVALACVSPKDMFALRWQSLPSTLSTRLREHRHRGPVLKGACRLAWTYLRKSADLDSTCRGTFEEVVKTIFFSRKYTLSKDAFITEPLIQFVRSVAQFDAQYAFRSIIFPLAQNDLLLGPSSRDLTYQSLDPDRIILGIRAFLAVIADIESGQRLAFPTNFPDDEDSVPALNSAAHVSHPQAAHVVWPQPRKAPHVGSEKVATQQLPAGLRDSYMKFCKLLSNILRVCDDQFGGQVSIDEKVASPNISRAPTFVDSWAFARRDDDEHQAERTGKFGYLDLLHTAVQAIPRCLSHDTPIKSVVDLLCTGTAHTEKNIAASSAISLKSIARQGFADFIVSRFSFFIFRYDNKYSTIADGGLLGPSHIESTLSLWVELLSIWEQELLHQSKDHAVDAVKLNASNSMTHVDHIESRGLFLLCSPSSRVRAFAVEILSIVTRLDEALGGSVARVYGVLTGTSSTLFLQAVDSRGNDFSSLEKAKLEKNMQANNLGSAFVQLCGSNIPEDAVLWYKIFPSFVQICFEICPTVVVQTREDVCGRLGHIQAQVEGPAEERPRAPTAGSLDTTSSRATNRLPTQSSQVLTEQYKLYLIFAASTIQKQESSASSTSLDNAHVRKSSRSSAGGQDSFDTAQNLFSKIVPMVYHESYDLRQAAVTGLSCINPNLYLLLLQCFDMQSRSLPNDFRGHYMHSRSASSPRRLDSHPVFRQELVNVYERTSRFLLENELHQDEWIMQHLSEFTWSLYEYLRQDSVVSETNGLRRHYCGLIQNFYLATLRSSKPSKWMPFAKRKAHFIAIEEWFIEVTPSDRRMPIAGLHSPRGRPTIAQSDRAAALETERLRTATSSAMATLCAGPFQAAKPEPDGQFNVLRLLAWTDKLLGLQGDKPQATGKKALVNLISHNMQYPAIAESIMTKLFGLEKSATIETYLDVLLDVYSQTEGPQVQEWRLVGAALFTMGHEESSIRMKSARLLRIFEESHENVANLRSFDIGISDKTTAVNKQAHFGISNELLAHHQDPEFACYLFSGYAEHFVHLPPESQRTMILVLLPWLRIIRLSKDSPSSYSGPTYMVLLNLIYITIHCVNSLQNEMRALWQALVLESSSGNARCILDFLIDLSLERRDQRYLRTAKQIVVFLATAPSDSAGAVIDFFLRRIEPKSMNPAAPATPIQKPESARDYPFVVDLSQVFPESAPSMRLSMGQLSLILLVDLVISDTSVSAGKLPELLQIILVLWDHHSQIVQEQAREMLVHLVHVFVISKADGDRVRGRAPSIEELVELIRRQDSKVGWAYNDNSDPEVPDEPPPAMIYVISEALSLFSETAPDIREELGQRALDWALQCPVRHIACRSLQIYRLVLRPVTQFHLSDIIMRCSSTIADQAPEYQCYAVDVLRTIHAIVRVEPPESQLLPSTFWATCASLETVHEWEYAEALSILEDLLEKLHLGDERTRAMLMSNKPTGWECNILTSFVPALYRGCSSRVNRTKSVEIINRAMRIGCQPAFSDLTCLKLGILANLPQILHSYDDPASFDPGVTTAISLRDCCEMAGRSSLAVLFHGFVAAKPSQSTFVANCSSAMGQDLFRVLDYDSVEFLMRLLLNPERWIRYWTLQLAQHLLPRIDIHDAKLKARGLDLFSPVVRLLATEFSRDALKVLDEVLPLTGISKDLRQLRVAHANHDPAQQGLKPPSEVGILYGAPTQTGWTILDPVTHNKRPRARISAVATNLLEKSEVPSRPSTLTPEVELQKEEILQDSYFPENAIHEISFDVPDPAQDVMNISELTAQLDDLDDFFEDNSSETAVDLENPMRSVSRSTPKTRPLALHQSRPSANDYTRLRSHHKLESSSSYTPDFRNASVNVSPALPPQAFPQPAAPPMSPSAFASPPMPEPKPVARPGMPARAFTMPVSNLQIPPSDRPIPKASPNVEPLSDDDLVGGRHPVDRTDSGTASRSPTPQKPFSSLRNSIKRLTSAGERHRRTNTKAYAGASPQVPPVPNEYLNPPLSSDI